MNKDKIGRSVLKQIGNIIINNVLCKFRPDCGGSFSLVDFVPLEQFEEAGHCQGH